MVQIHIAVTEQSEEAMRARCNSKIRTSFLPAVVFLFCLVSLALAADPVVVELHYQNGVKFYKRGLYDRAIQEFEKTVSLDPERKDAQEYLEKIKAEQKQKKEVEAGMSKDALLQNLYTEGRRLYAKGDYEAALEVFNKILAIKPIDDFASFHKESCEIYISKKLARQKKIDDRERLKAQNEEERLNRKKEIEEKKAEKQEMLKKRAEINEERRQQQKEREARAKEEKMTASQQKKQEVQTAALNKQEEKTKTREERLADKKEEKARRLEEKRAERQQKLDAAQKAKEDKRAEHQQKIEAAQQAKEAKQAERQQKHGAVQKTKEEKQAERQQKIEAARQAKEAKRAAAQESKEKRSAERQEKIEAKKKAREEKQEASKQRKVEKATVKEEKVLNKKKAVEEAKEERAVRQSVKELYIQGVENYAKKLYADAIASFEAVIDAESRSGTQIYTNSAKRLMEKARKKQEGAGI